MASKVEVSVNLRDRITEGYKRIKKTITNSNGQVNASLKNTAKTAQNEMSKIKKFAKGAAEGIKDFAKSFGPTAIVVAGLTAALMAFKKAVDFVRQVSRDFEEKLSKIKAIVQPTAQGFVQLSEKARELGKSTIFTASQVADAFTEMGKLGLKTKDIADSSKAVLSLAAIAQTDMATASETVVKTMNQFNLEAADSQRIVDVMASSFTNSALDMGKFAESMKYVGTTARLVGLSVEETTALLAVMANNGVEASMAGTSLNQAMIQLTNKGSKANKMFKKMGLETATFREKMMALKESNIDVGSAFELLDVRAARSLNVLMENLTGTEKSVDSLTEKFKGSIGVANEMADTMLDNVAGASKILTSAQENLGIAIGDAFGSDKQKRIEFYTMIVNMASEAVEAHKDDLMALSNLITSLLISSVKLLARAFAGLSVIIDTVKAGFFAMIELVLKGVKKIVQAVNWMSNKLGKGDLISLDYLNDTIAEFGDSADKAALNALKAFDIMIGGGEKAATKINEAEKKLEVARRVRSEKEAARKAAEAASGLGSSLPGGGGDKTKEHADKMKAILEQNGQEFMLMQDQGAQKMKEHADKMKAILEQNGQDFILIQDQGAQKMKEQKQRQYDEAIEKEKKHAEEVKRIRMRMANFILGGASRLTSALGNLAAVKGQNELKSAEAAGASEERLNAIRKKTFEQQKKYQLASAGMALGAGIINALGITPPHLIPWAVGFAGATGGIQLAAIKAQKFSGGGVAEVQGHGYPTHGDHVPALLDPGEVVFNKRQFKDLTSGRMGGNTVTVEGDNITIGAGADEGMIRNVINETREEKLMRLSQSMNEAKIQGVVS